MTKKNNFSFKWLLVSAAAHMVMIYLVALFIYLEKNTFKPYTFGYSGIHKIKIDINNFSIKPHEIETKESPIFKKVKQIEILKTKDLVQKQTNDINVFDLNKSIDNNSTYNENIIDQSKKNTFPNKGIELSYGNDFFKLTSEEQEYLTKEWFNINFINTVMTKKVVATYDYSKLKENESAVVSFYFNTDGSVSDFTFEKDSSSDYVFKSVVAETILHSVKFYPKPSVKTLMKINVFLEKRKDGPVEDINRTLSPIKQTSTM